MKFVIDCLGGDKGAAAMVGGALIGLRAHGDLSVILVGDEKEITELLADASAEEKKRIEIVHAPDVITGEDKPTDAIRLKKDASMIRAIKLLREDESISALISTGATGALVAASMLRIGRIRGLRRPAFCPVLPTMNGGIVGICDSGANVDILPTQLAEFAILGSRFLESAYGVKKPRVALLNIGTETEKGDDLRKNAYPLLAETPGIHFVGNMESRDLLSGKYDLVVCDGFAGNVLIKATEGTALELLKKLKKDIYSKKKYMFGALFMKKMFDDEKEFMNYHNYGGSVLLGLEKTVIKGHGSSDAAAVGVCIEQAVRMQNAHMNDQIAESIKALYEKEEPHV